MEKWGIELKRPRTELSGEWLICDKLSNQTNKLCALRVVDGSWQIAMPRSAPCWACWKNDRATSSNTCDGWIAVDVWPGRRRICADVQEMYLPTYSVRLCQPDLYVYFYLSVTFCDVWRNSLVDTCSFQQLQQKMLKASSLVARDPSTISRYWWLV